MTRKRLRGLSRHVRQGDGDNTALPDGFTLFVRGVPSQLAGLIARLKLSPIAENSNTFWRFYPQDQYQRPAVEAIARLLRRFALHVNVTPGSPTLEGAHYKIGRVTTDLKKPKKKKRLRMLRAGSKKKRRLERIRRNDPDRIDHEKLKRSESFENRPLSQLNPMIRLSLLAV
jgi:hypothetical protein